MPRSKKRAAIVLLPGAGRAYAMGPLRAVFEADCEETRGRYSISEWWLEPYTRGPGAHQHAEDDVFFVLEGTMSFLVGGRWGDAPAGSLVIAPGGTPHDFENRTAKRAGALNVSVPGDFEPHMKGIAEWFRERSAADSRTERSKPKKLQTIDAYLATVAPDRRVALEKLRRTIRSILPAAEECISYSMPAFRYEGHVVAGFLATKKGCSYFPFSGTTLANVADAVKAYSQTKSALHFDPKKGLLTTLVRKLVRMRIAELPA